MLRRLAALSLLACAAVQTASVQTAAAQTPAERAQGYALRGDTTVFVFDPALYGGAQGATVPRRVAVTGAFRGWSADMDAFALVPAAAGVWTLAVPNAGFAAVAPASPFKFRVDDAAGDGRWLDPSPGAPNAQGGNLVFLLGVTPPRLVAELRGERAVWVRVTGRDRPLDPAAYRITRWDGLDVPVAAVYPNEAETALLVPAVPLAATQVHYVTMPGTPALRSAARFDGVWRTLASAKTLGAELTMEHRRNGLYRAPGVTIRLFAPRADSVRVYLYDGTTGPERESVAMARDADGVWEAARDGSYDGVWYDFGVYGPAGPGSAFTNQTGRRYSDPYGRVSDDSWGRTMVAPRTTPATPLAGGRPPMASVVSYEVHVQDFTDRLPVAPALRGTFAGMATPGLTNARGEPVGLDHIARLGVNTVHLMPVQEYLNYPDSTWSAAFAGDPFMQSMGVAAENYDWGYRITHSMAIEGRYRTHGSPHGAERAQFRDLVQAFHDRGIAVVVDLVFNHTGENMEGRDNLLNFSGIDRLYYYRTSDDGALLGGYGNETKSENRPMVQRWLVDQCRALVDEFGVDGFRVDLAGQTDEQTLRALRAALPADLVWYGEPWIASTDPDYEANPAWDWYKADAPIPFFQDDARNALQGTPDAPRDPATDRGWAGGNAGLREAAVNAVLNRWPDEHDPTQGINYLDIHDNWALADRFARTTAGDGAWDGRAGVDAAAVRIAATLLLTSLGPVVLNGGTEILRSKGAAPRPDQISGQIVARTAMSPVYINGRGDTYNLRTPNQFDWARVGATPATGDPDDVAAMLAWWRGLVALRLSPAGAVFRTASADTSAVTFFRPADPHALGYLAGGATGPAVLVLLNTGDAAVQFDALPAGVWRSVARATRTASEIDAGSLTPATVGAVQAAPWHALVPAGGVSIWVRDGN